MRLIVAALLLLCSADAVAQAAPPIQLEYAQLEHTQLERGNGPESCTRDARRCQEMSLDRPALRWLRWRD